VQRLEGTKDQLVRSILAHVRHSRTFRGQAFLRHGGIELERRIFFDVHSMPNSRERGAGDSSLDDIGVSHE
jgi:hypothetical protein